MSLFHRSRRGFTLVELLVVIAIIGILVALLLPAIQAAREASRRSQCSNNLKQLGTALQNYHDNFRRFPIGYVCDQIGGGGGGKAWRESTWAISVLPFIEQRSLYDSLDALAQTNPGLTTNSWPDSSQAMSDITNTPIPAFMCPSDPNCSKTTSNWGLSDYNDGVGSNYVTCNGSLKLANNTTTANATYSQAGNGMFFYLTAVGMADVIDGTSTTVMASEILQVREPTPSNNERDWRGRIYRGSWGGATFNTLESPNTQIPDEQIRCENNNKSAPCINNSSNPNSMYARSMHPGGVNAVMGDASVRFVTNSIDRSTWQSLGTRNGGEAISSY